MNITVRAEDIRLGDKVSVGGPFKVVAYKSEHEETVELGFGSWLGSEKLKFDRGTLIDIVPDEGRDPKIYINFVGEGLDYVFWAGKDSDE